MPKGRRERDRPKAAPGAPYNPNKRVKLSYDSASEEDARQEQQAVSEQVPPRKEQRENALRSMQSKEAPYTAGHEPYDEEVHVASTEARGEEGDEQVSGHTVYETPAEARVTNTRTGQWHALGSLAWQDDGNEDEGDGADADPAMEYLRSVRAERQLLPDILSSSRTPTHGIGGGYAEDQEGFDVGHAIIAAPEAVSEVEDPVRDPRGVFTGTLKKRFHTQRHQLHLPPSSTALAALDENHPISYPPSNKKAKAEWLKLLTSTAPASAQVRSMSQDTVFRLLQLIQDRYLVRQQDIKSLMSAWIWSLLARLDDVGLMDNDHVYDVRAFGKKAVLVLVSFRSSETAAQLEDIADEDTPGVGAAVSDTSGEEDMPSTSEKGSDVQSSLRENTLATLDTILVIVGEVFGQRDLLEFRQQWEVGDGTLSEA